jgi:hypothetical protein
MEAVTPPSQINPAITPQLEEVILHAIAKDPDDRYLSVEHLLGEFELALPPGANMLLLSAARVSTPIPMITPTALPAMRTPLPRQRPSQPPPVLSAPVKRSRTPLIALLALLLIGGGIGAFVLAGHGKDPEKIAAAPLPAPPKDPDPPLTQRKVGAEASIADTPPTVAKVKLKIATKPQHALIKLNGIDLGRAPLDMDVAPVDTASLEIVADGYETQSRSLALVTDQTLDITLTHKQHVSSGSTPPKEHPKPPKAGSAAPPPDSDLDIRMHR